MNLIVPMAGIGKRMRPHTLTVPKPLIPVANKPIVERLVEDISATATEKIDNIGFIIGAFGEQVKEDLMAVAKRLGAQGHIFHQEEAKGTGHAILQAQDLLEGPVFVAFADTLFKADFHIDGEKDGIIWCKQVADPSAYGVVTLHSEGYIDRFVEKPQEFVSDMAIIGVYYFKDGAGLRSELQYLIDEEIMDKGEYQLTDAMENMKSKGKKLYLGEVEEWLDCGNKANTLFTNQRILELKKDSEKLQSDDAHIQNSIVLEPCAIAAGAVIKNSVVGPHVSIGPETIVENSVVKNSMIQGHTLVRDMQMEDSMVGNHGQILGESQILNLGDYNVHGIQ